MIVRTAVAYCDAVQVTSSGTKSCLNKVNLDPGSTQHYRELAHLGWRNVTNDDGVKTLCPEHTGLVRGGKNAT